MSDTFSINEHDQVVPYTSGRRCNDTREWRDATDLELQQRDDILGLERDNQKLLSRIAELQADPPPEGDPDDVAFKHRPALFVDDPSNAPI